MMASYQTKQNKIYEDHFREVMPTLAGVETATYVKEPDAGYFVVWLFADTVVAKVADFNLKINNIVPSFRFDETNLHTTITVYQSQSQKSFVVDEVILETLASTCKNLNEGLLSAVQIDFKEWLFNKGAVILAGQGNEAFWQVGAEFQTAGTMLGHHWRMPWGAHMTAARFLSASDKTSDLLALTTKTQVIGLCQPCAVLVGHYKCGPSSLCLTPFFKRKIGE
jgi:hypothetical protein